VPEEIFEALIAVKGAPLPAIVPLKVPLPEPSTVNIALPPEFETTNVFAVEVAPI
jgi:hypothetical protein